MDNFFENEAKWMLVLMFGPILLAMVMGIVIVTYLSFTEPGEKDSCASQPDCAVVEPNTGSRVSPTDEQGVGGSP